MEKMIPVNLFWTGGWDSTFRLLQLVLTEKQTVQPYYLIDPKRQSLRNEIKARREIKERLFKEYPYTRELILPTIFYEVGDITPDEQVVKAYATMRKTKHVEYQYLWLSLFCRQQGIHDMELCVVKHRGLPGPPERSVFGSFLVPIEGSTEDRMDESFHNTEVETLFGCFRYPVRGYTKMDMEVEAQSGGWADYLCMTWFCQSPVKGRYPCGTCHPCGVAISQGYSRRIPWHRRVYAKLGLEKLRQWGAKAARKINPGFHQWKA